MTARPIVGLSADVKMIDPHAFHCVGDKYVKAVLHAADAIPVLLPALGDDVRAQDWLELVDGIVLTGSYSNVHPRHYNGNHPAEGTLLDPDRDAATLSLIPAAIAQGVPLFGICRGFQEMNVAFGGSLHQHVHDVPGMNDHREDSSLSLAEQYSPTHPVELAANGVLEKLADGPLQHVNSLHGQGIQQLAPGLTIEATAPDGLIEAFSVKDAKTFALAVQWHPEWLPQQHAFYMALWRSFGAACQQRAARRHRQEPVN